MLPTLLTRMLHMQTILEPIRNLQTILQASLQPNLATFLDIVHVQEPVSWYRQRGGSAPHIGYLKLEEVALLLDALVTGLGAGAWKIEVERFSEVGIEGHSELLLSSATIGATIRWHFDLKKPLFGQYCRWNSRTAGAGLLAE